MKLDVHPYTTAYRSSQPKSSKASAGVSLANSNHNINTPANSLFYELSSVIVHKGKIDSGHYINYSREGSDWFAFDDSKVVLVNEAEVLSAEAYLLFYMVSNLDV
jgi:ubiquitin carboxyl-terminal hydrolase 22/27/51